MADQITAANTDGGSPERVAYDIWAQLRSHSKGNLTESFPDFVGRQLALYAQCLNATSSRAVDTTKLT